MSRKVILDQARNTNPNSDNPPGFGFEDDMNFYMQDQNEVNNTSYEAGGSVASARREKDKKENLTLRILLRDLNTSHIQRVITLLKDDDKLIKMAEKKVQNLLATIGKKGEVVSQDSESLKVETMFLYKKVHYSSIGLSHFTFFFFQKFSKIFKKNIIFSKNSQKSSKKISFFQKFSIFWKILKNL